MYEGPQNGSLTSSADGRPIGQVKASNMLASIRRACSALSLEPLIFMHYLSYSLILGGSLHLRFMQYKICLVQLNHGEEICSSLDVEENKPVLEEALKIQNLLMRNLEIIAMLPDFFYVFVMGGIADSFGAKVPLLWAAGGSLLGYGVDIIAVVFVKELPMSFFYVQLMQEYFGGSTVYHIAVYTYGSVVSTDKSRSTRLASFEGTGGIGSMIGIVLSPVLFNFVGFLGMYTIKFVLFVIGFIYLVSFVGNIKAPEDKKEPMEKSAPSQPGNRNTFRRLGSFLKFCTVDQVKNLAHTLFKKRPNKLHWLLLIQLLAYGIFLFDPFNSMYTNYFQHVLPTFNAQESSNLSTFLFIFRTLTLIIAIPLLRNFCNLHESVINVFMVGSCCISMYLLAFVTNTWQLYLFHVPSFFLNTVYTLTKSLMAQLVQENEMGKLSSLVSLVWSLGKLATNPVYRSLYDATFDSFPGAFLLLAGALLTCSTIMYFVVFLHRGRIAIGRKDPALSSFEQGQASSVSI